MFFEDGWVPLSDVTAEVFRKLQAIQAAGKLATGPGGLKTVLAISVWDICEASPKIGATGADGRVIDASRELVAWADPQALSNEHVDLLVGSIGSSSLPTPDGSAPTAHDLALRYGPFLNLPVALPINSYQSSMSYLEDEVTSYDPRDEDVLRAARTIVEMGSADGLFTREIARLQLGAGLSRRKFKLAWALATTQLPDLAAPNRWTGL